VSSRALVTGGAGFIGSHLTERLIDEGWDVLVVDDLSTGHLDNLATARARGHVKFHQIDIREPEFTTAVERFRPDAIFHLAARVSAIESLVEPLRDAEVNVLGTINVLEAARRAGTERLVFASTGAIYGDAVKLPARETSTLHPRSPLGISKKAVEDYLRFYRDTHAIEYASLRLASVFGPRQDPFAGTGAVAIFARLMIDGKRPVIFGDGHQTRDFVFVDDVVDAFVRAGGVEGSRCLNVGTGRATTIVELFRLLADLVGFRELPVFRDPRPGEVSQSVLDSAAAAKTLGWRPWTSLEEGLALTVDWMRPATPP
jgi:UDP-glucose 4-epimerase